MLVRTLFDAAAVQARISELSARLHRDYADSPLAIVCIAEGALRFVETLKKQLEERGTHPELHVVRVRRSEGIALGEVQVEAFDPALLEDRDVLVVEDVVDEGATLRSVLELVGLAETRSVRTAVLVDKRERRREAVPVDYAGFEVGAGWVVGYGMDLDGSYRELDAICVASPDGE